MRKAIKRLVPTVLAVGLLVYTLRGLPLESLLSVWHEAQLGWVGLGCSLATIQLILRGVRWKMLLQSMGYRPTLGHTLTAMLAGNAASMIVPGSGELIRCTVMARTDRVPVSQSIGSVVAERILDLFALVILLVLSLPFGAGQLFKVIKGSTTNASSSFSLNNNLVVLFLALCLVSAVTGAFVWQRFGTVIAKRIKLRERAIGIKQGLLSVKRVRQKGRFVSLNGLIHLLSLLSLLVWLLAIPTTELLPVSIVPVLFGVLSLGGLTIPTQANLGTFHFLASRVLIVYGVQQTSAVAWATFTHAISTLLNILLSATGFLLAAQILKRPVDAPLVESQTIIDQP